MASVSISGLRRNIKNVAHNYTDAQVKVREATSNDPWGPSSTQMSEIADLTYNMVAFSEIMQMIWKRLNDHGKNWRHVYKALVLLEYLIKTGSEKVAQQCKENIFAIQTLKDFQFVEENKDQGLNVREKAKAMVSLLKDDERLKNERVRALKAKERFAQSTAGIGSDTAFGGGGGGLTGQREHEGDMASPGEPDPLRPDIELARPQTHGEEELQLQLALAMSREEADAEETKKKSDDMRLTLAIQKSKADNSDGKPGAVASAAGGGSALNDLVDLNFGGGASGQGPSPPQRTAASLDPWSPAGHGGDNGGGDPWGGNIVSQSTIPDPWGGIGAHGVPPSRASPLAFHQGSPPQADPWGSGGESAGGGGLYPNLGGAGVGGPDPWAAQPQQASASPVPAPVDPFSPGSPVKTSGSADLLAADWTGNGAANGNGGILGAAGGNGSPSHMAPQAAANPWDLSGLDPMAGGATGARPKNAVESLLGEHSDLVNLDNLTQLKTANPAAKNPFADQPNPFQAAAAPKPTMNQLMTGNQASSGLGSAWPDGNQQQQQQQQGNQEINPFF